MFFLNISSVQRGTLRDLGNHMNHYLARVLLQFCTHFQKQNVIQRNWFELLHYTFTKMHKICKDN